MLFYKKSGEQDYLSCPPLFLFNAYLNPTYFFNAAIALS